MEISLTKYQHTNHNTYVKNILLRIQRLFTSHNMKSEIQKWLNLLLLCDWCYKYGNINQTNLLKKEDGIVKRNLKIKFSVWKLKGKHKMFYANKIWVSHKEICAKLDHRKQEWLAESFMTSPNHNLKTFFWVASKRWGMSSNYTIPSTSPQH